MEGMGHTGPRLALVATALVLSGCGTALPAGDPTVTARSTSQVGVEASRSVEPGEPSEPAEPIDAAGSGQGVSSGRDVPTVTLSTGPVFPLTLRRTGGIADFHDTVVLTGDGVATVDTASIAGRTCRLSAAQRATLLVGLSTLRLTGSHPAPTTTADRSDPGPPADGEAPTDPITVTVTDVHARPVDLTDPSLGQIAALVSALVTDVTLTAPATTTCTDAPGQADASGGAGSL